MGVHVVAGRYVDDFGNPISGEMVRNSAGQLVEVEHPSIQMDRMIAAQERAAEAVEQYNRDYNYYESLKFYDRLRNQS